MNAQEARAVTMRAAHQIAPPKLLALLHDALPRTAVMGFDSASVPVVVRSDARSAGDAEAGRWTRAEVECACQVLREEGYEVWFSEGIRGGEGSVLICWRGDCRKAG